MKRFMLDTNTVSHLVKGHPLVTRAVTRTTMSSLCISAITGGELLYGLARRPQAKRLHSVVDELLRRIDVLPWDVSIGRRYSFVRAALERVGKTLAPLDLLIAAHALGVSAVLVTNDRSFYQVPELKIEDWTL